MKIFFAVDQSFFAPFIILHPNDCILRKKFEQGNSFFTFKLRVNIWNNIYLQQSSFTQLCFRINNANGINIVSKQLNTIRLVIPKRINIKNTTSYRKLSWLIHKISSFKSE